MGLPLPLVAAGRRPLRVDQPTNGEEKASMQSETRVRNLQGKQAPRGGEVRPRRRTSGGPNANDIGKEDDARHADTASLFGSGASISTGVGQHAAARHRSRATPEWTD
jgi:hypothetical protein